MGDDSDEQLEQRVDQLEQQLSKMLPGRRGVLKGLGAAALGGAAVGGATGGAAGQSAAGQIGTSSSPVDVEAANVNAGSVSTGELYAKDRAPTAVVKTDGSDVVANGANGELSRGSDAATVLQDAVDHAETIGHGAVYVLDDLLGSNGHSVTSTINIASDRVGIMTPPTNRRLVTIESADTASPVINVEGAQSNYLSRCFIRGIGIKNENGRSGSNDLLRLKYTKAFNLQDVYLGATTGHGVDMMSTFHPKFEHVHVTCGDAANDKHIFNVHDDPDTGEAVTGFIADKIIADGYHGHLFHYELRHGGNSPRGLTLSDVVVENGSQQAGEPNIYLGSGRDFRLDNVVLTGIANGSFVDADIGFGSDIQINNSRFKHDAGLSGPRGLDIDRAKVHIDNTVIDAAEENRVARGTIYANNCDFTSFNATALQANGESHLSNIHADGGGTYDITHSGNKVWWSNIEAANGNTNLTDITVIEADDGSFGYTTWAGESTDANGQIVLDLDGRNIEYSAAPVVDVDVTSVNDANLTGNALAQVTTSTSDVSGNGNIDNVTVTFKDDGGNLVPSGDVTATIKLQPS